MPTPLVPAVLPYWAVAALIGLSLTAAVVDLRCGKVPNWLTYPAILLALVGHAIWNWRQGQPWGHGVADAGAGFAVGFGLLLIPWLARGIGGGDTKLLGAIGALGGWRFAVATLLYGCVVAVVMAIVVMIRRRVVRQTLSRVWTALKLLATPGAKPADPTGPDSPKIPFAVALCAGSLAALLEAVLGLRLWSA